MTDTVPAFATDSIAHFNDCEGPPPGSKAVSSGRPSGAISSSSRLYCAAAFGLAAWPLDCSSCVDADGVNRAIKVRSPASVPEAP